MGWLRRTGDWLFRDRRTGRIVIGQVPNVPLLVWFAATLGRVLALGTAASAFGYIGTAALVYWAADEIARGVNPFRRILGAGVLIATAIHLVHSH